MSPELQKFFDELGAWIDAGCPKHDDFLKGVGSCTNLSYFAESLENGDELTKELNRLLEAEFDDPFFPFGGWDVYKQGNHYANTERLAWINKHRSCPGESGVDT